MLNTLPKEIEGYLPSEVAYQVKEDNLYIYLRVVRFDLVQRTFEPLNKVNTVKIPMKEIRNGFKEGALNARTSINPMRFSQKPKQIKKSNLLFTYKGVDDGSFRFKISYPLRVSEEITLVEGIFDIKEERMYAISKCAKLRSQFTSLKRLIMMDKQLSFDEEDLEIIRELLSIVACGYERKTFNFHCCDANEIIQKIDSVLGEPEEM